jgi:hypothetical protein
MNTSAIRILCLLMIFASIVVNYRMIGSRDTKMADFDIHAAIMDVIRKQGLPLRDNPIKLPKVLSQIIYFQRPECSQASMVMPYPLSFEALPLLARVIDADFERRFIYLGGSWNAEDRISMHLEWAKQKILGFFGASRYLTAKTAIVLAEPSDCRSAAPIDWRFVWDRDRYRNATGAGRASLSRPPGA